MAVTNYWFSHSMNLLHYLLCFFFEFYDIAQQNNYQCFDYQSYYAIRLQFIYRGPSGENGGVTNLTSINVPTSNAFPMIPT